MYTFSKNAVSAQNKSDVKEFVEFWNQFYKADQKEYIENLHLGSALTERNIRKLIAWKMPAISKKSSIQKALRIRRYINTFRSGDITEEEMDKKLKQVIPSGTNVLRVFIKHIAKPTAYPIYDQHVFRAYCKEVGGKSSEIAEKYDAYRAFFFSIYKILYGEHKDDNSKATVENMKRIDNALMAYGQFLAVYD